VPASAQGGCFVVHKQVGAEMENSTPQTQKNPGISAIPGFSDGLRRQNRFFFESFAAQRFRKKG
jgi:hypothetical protein